MQPATLVPFYIETASCWSKVEPRQYKTFFFYPKWHKINSPWSWLSRQAHRQSPNLEQAAGCSWIWHCKYTWRENFVTKKKPISCQMSHNYLQKDLQVNVWDITTLTIYAVFIFTNSMLYRNSRKCWSGWDTQFQCLQVMSVPYVLLSYSGQTVHWNTTVIQI